MYDRRVDDCELKFIVSGLLWHRSLVMEDKETNSWWSQLQGECKHGDLKGKKLKTIPSLLTDWRTWKRLQPKTSVIDMSKTVENYDTDFYMGLEKYVVGLVHDGSSRAWNFARLKNQFLINDSLESKNVLIFFDVETWTPFLYDRQVGNLTLTFKRLESGEFCDRESESHWDLRSGKCISGKHSGKRLERLPGITSYASAWKNLHPKSSYWKPK